MRQVFLEGQIKQEKLTLRKSEDLMFPITARLYYQSKEKTESPIPTPTKTNPYQQAKIITEKPKNTWSSDSLSETHAGHIARTRCAKLW